MTLAALMCALLASCGDSGRIEIPVIPEAGEESTSGADAADTLIDISLSDIDIAGDTTDGYYNITRPGTYRLFGSLSCGVRVEVAKTDTVTLILDGAEISNSSGAAVYIASADKVIVTLGEGGENILSDGSDYAARSAEPNACLFSKDDLTVDGSGSLTVVGHCNNGIGTKNDLKILSGTISISAPRNALKGNDSVEISGGNITVSGCKDGIKSDNETDAAKGYVEITGGEHEIVCADDGIQAFRSVKVKNAVVKITAGDKAVNCDGDVNADEGCIVSE